MRRVMLSNKLVILISIILIATIFTGCSTFNGFSVMKKGSSGPNSMSYSYKYFTGTYDTTLSMEKGIEIEIDYDVVVKTGELVIKLVNSKGNAVWKENFTKNDKGKVEIKIDEAGIYEVVVEGKKTEGSFDIRYHESES